MVDQMSIVNMSFTFEFLVFLIKLDIIKSSVIVRNTLLGVSIQQIVIETLSHHTTCFSFQIKLSLSVAFMTLERVFGIFKSIITLITLDARIRVPHISHCLIVLIFSVMSIYKGVIGVYILHIVETNPRTTKFGVFHVSVVIHLEEQIFTSNTDHTSLRNQHHLKSVRLIEI